MNQQFRQTNDQMSERGRREDAASTTEGCTETIKALEDKDTQLHTFQMKRDRSFRVALRNANPSRN